LAQVAKFRIEQYNPQDDQMIKKIFPTLALAIFASMLGMGIVSPLLPLYAEDLGASGVWIGIVFASFAISRTIITPFVGRLSDRGGRKLLLTIGLFGSAIISLGYIWASNVAQLTLVRLIHGAAGGMVQPITQAYIGDIAPKGEEGKWMGYFNAAFFTGFGVGPLMGGVLSDHLGMSASFIAMGSLNLLAFLIVAFFLPEISHRKTAAGSYSSYREMSASGMMKGLFSSQLAFSLGRGAFATFLPIFAATYLGLNPSLIGILLAVNILLTSVLQAYGGNIADRFSRRGLVIFGSLASAISIALIPLGGNFWQLFWICALSGVTGAFPGPAASALSVDEGRKFGMGSTMAALSMAFSIGMGTGPLLGGVIADFADINLVFYFSAGIGILGTGLFVWFARR
jgi:DHA1 family multidrug resistance protein-like MFS transporter